MKITIKNWTVDFQYFNGLSGAGLSALYPTVTRYGK